MLDCDREAPRYDETRGGLPRASAAAGAICRLVPPETRVARRRSRGHGESSRLELSAAGYDVVVVDRSVGMLGVAQTRLPGRVVAGDATRLPLADGSAEVVVMMWLLHLLASTTMVEAALAEAARVLRPGGSCISTVDKGGARHGDRPAFDERGAVLRAAASVDLTLAGETTYVGYGQRTSGGGEPVYTVVRLQA